jgi:hypothetical protein
VPFTNKFARYKMPSIKHTPEIASFIIEDPAADGPYGAKGVGEISSIPTTPAITNAIFEACGVRVTRLPVDQDLLLLTMKARADRSPRSRGGISADLHFTTKPWHEWGGSSLCLCALW